MAPPVITRVSGICRKERNVAVFDVIGSLGEVLPDVPTTTDDALAMFDNADPVDPGYMIGMWRGAEIPTGHPLDGILEASGWYGKEFIDAETVRPLLFRRRHGTRTWAMNPIFVPVQSALKVRIPSFAFPLMRPAISALRPVVQTRRARARLRSTTYRGE
jgi:GXWXG protein